MRAAPHLIELPIPPLSIPTAENAYCVGEAVLLALSDGRRMRGTLLAFRADRGRLLVRLDSQARIETQYLSFKEIRTLHVLRDRKIERLAPTLQVRGKVVLPPTRQEFEIVLDNDERLAGHTLGFRIDHNGLHLYPADEAGVYTHLFVASHAIRMQRVGPLLGKALVEANLVTYEALSAELRAQHRLREQPIGEYLMSARLVSAQELEAALERQRSTPHVRLGEVLVREGVITEAQLADVLGRQEQNRKMPLGEMLVAAGLVSIENVTQTLAGKLGVPFIDLRQFAVDINAVERVDEDIAREHRAIPLYAQDGRMVVALENPMQWQALEALRRWLEMDIEAVMATAADIDWAIDKYYGNRRTEAS